MLSRVLRAGALAGLSQATVKGSLTKFVIPFAFSSLSHRPFSQKLTESDGNAEESDIDLSDYPPLDPKKSPKGLPAEYFSPNATPLLLLPNEIIEEKLQNFHRAVMSLGINDVVRKSKYDIFREFEEKGLLKLSPELAKQLIEESSADEETEGLNFWELMSGGVVGVIILIILYLIIFPPEHPVRPAEYPYLRIRAKKYPWGDTDLFDMLSVKLFGHDKYAHAHGHGHDDHASHDDHAHDNHGSHHGGGASSSDHHTQDDHDDHDNHDTQDDHDDHASQDEQAEDHDEGEQSQDEDH